MEHELWITKLFNDALGSAAGSMLESMGVHPENPARAFTNYVAMEILVALIIVAGFEAPTQVIFVTVGCAVLAFCYYHFEGVRIQGPVKYVKHFAGPVWWLAWLMLPIEVISHLGRNISLSVRLYANMFAGEQVFL